MGSPVKRVVNSPDLIAAGAKAEARRIGNPTNPAGPGSKAGHACTATLAATCTPPNRGQGGSWVLQLLSPPQPCRRHPLPPASQGPSHSYSLQKGVRGPELGKAMRLRRTTNSRAPWTRLQRTTLHQPWSTSVRWLTGGLLGPLTAVPSQQPSLSQARHAIHTLARYSRLQVQPAGPLPKKEHTNCTAPMSLQPFRT